MQHIHFSCNKLLLLYNLIKIKSLGAVLSDGASLTGDMKISINRNANVHIGRNFHLVSTTMLNPLCGNRAVISVSKGAELIIGDNVGMSSPTIWVRKSLKIGNNVNLGGGTTVMDSDAHSLNYLHRRKGTIDMANRVDKEIVIDDDVLIGAYSIILKGVHIGARSVIGAGSVVAKDIPADCIATGNPAKVIRYINQ